MTVMAKKQMTNTDNARLFRCFIRWLVALKADATAVPQEMRQRHGSGTVKGQAEAVSNICKVQGKE